MVLVKRCGRTLQYLAIYTIYLFAKQGLGLRPSLIKFFMFLLSGFDCGEYPLRARVN